MPRLPDQARLLPIALGLIATVCLFRPGCAEGLDISRATISELQAELTNGSLTSERLVRFYLARIRQIDSGPDGLHSVLAINPDALREAKALDQERQSKGSRGPLHGIPILVKDNIDTAGALPTTAGSLALVKNFRPDATLIARLRAAGAIVLGKTNLSEWANFRSSHATSGWSAVGGLTRNPYALDRTACGSSSGSAVAVAAGLAPAAIGSETDGSITCPSAMNGVAGIKPSIGIVPRTGIVPISVSQDTAGPIAHSAADLALLMSVIAGADPVDPATEAGTAKPQDFAALHPATLAGMRFGMLRYPNDPLPMIDATYDAALQKLRDAGATLIEVPMPDTSKFGDDETLVLKTEFKAGLAAYLHDAPPAVTARSLAALIAFNNATPAETVLFGQDLFESSEATAGLQDPAYLKARADSLRMAGADGIDRILTTNRLDALVAPTTGPAWRIDLVYGDNGPPAVATLPAVAGYPHLTMPMGSVKGLPLGISFIGSAYQDAKLLSIGKAWEALTTRMAAPTRPHSVD